MARKKTRTRRSFGRIDKLPSGRYRARYEAPTGELVKAPSTFPAKIDAEGWLADERRLIDLDIWTSPEERERKAEAAGVTVSEFFEQWLPMDERRETTQFTYRSIYRNRIEKYLGHRPLSELTAVEIEQWIEAIRQDFPGTKKRNADAYTMLATLCKKAVALKLIDATPTVVAGAGRRPKSAAKPLLTMEEFTAVIDGMPEIYRMALVMADHLSMRIGEWTELRRKDIRLHYIEQPDGTRVPDMKIHIQRGVSYLPGKVIVGPTKSEAGDRWSAVSPALVPALLEHMEKFSQTGPDGLIFVNHHGDQIVHDTFRNKLAAQSLKVIGRKVGPHDFRHHGATEFARTGATIKDLMQRLGHTTPAMAMHYQHASQERDATLAGKMPVMWLPSAAASETETEQ